MTLKRDREGNEEDILVFRPQSADEALRVRDVLAAVGVEVEVPEAAVRVMFANGKESIDVRVPIGQADAALAALEEAFGAERMPARAASGPGDLTVEAVAARARELEAEDERERLRAEARRAERAAAPPPAPEGGGWVGTLVYGLVSVALLVLLFWMFARQM